jgi:hypothetical protein
VRQSWYFNTVIIVVGPFVQLTIAGATSPELLRKEATKNVLLKIKMSVAASDDIQILAVTTGSLFVFRFFSACEPLDYGLSV